MRNSPRRYQNDSGLVSTYPDCHKPYFRAADVTQSCPEMRRVNAVALTRGGNHDAAVIRYGLPPAGRIIQAALRQDSLAGCQVEAHSCRASPQTSRREQPRTVKTTPSSLEPLGVESGSSPSVPLRQTTNTPNVTPAPALTGHLRHFPSRLVLRPILVVLTCRTACLSTSEEQIGQKGSA